MFLGIGRVRGISRRLLDGLHDSDVVRPNGYVERENSSTSLQESTPRFLLPGIAIDFVAMMLCAQPRFDPQDTLATLDANASFEMRSWRRLK